MVEVVSGIVAHAGLLHDQTRRNVVGHGERDDLGHVERPVAVAVGERGLRSLGRIAASQYSRARRQPIPQ